MSVLVAWGSKADTLTTAVIPEGKALVAYVGKASAQGNEPIAKVGGQVVKSGEARVGGEVQMFVPGGMPARFITGSAAFGGKK